MIHGAEPTSWSHERAIIVALNKTNLICSPATNLIDQASCHNIFRDSSIAPFSQALTPGQVNLLILDAASNRSSPALS
jgi:hypothetical protein